MPCQKIVVFRQRVLDYGWRHKFWVDLNFQVLLLPILDLGFGIIALNVL